MQAIGRGRARPPPSTPPLLLLHPTVRPLARPRTLHPTQEAVAPSKTHPLPARGGLVTLCRLVFSGMTPRPPVAAYVCPLPTQRTTPQSTMWFWRIRMVTDRTCSEQPLLSNERLCMLITYRQIRYLDTLVHRPGKRSPVVQWMAHCASEDV